MLRKHLEKKGLCDCGEKGEKIDLLRALRFDEKKDRLHPKMVVFNTLSVGAFKRSINTFFIKHYTSADPPCHIIIPDAILDNLVMEATKSPVKPGKHTLNYENDPFLKLMSIPESDPKFKRLEEVYIGTSLKVKHTRALIYRASQTDSPVLILGESGTGKDVIATQIFKNSTVFKKDFYRINCSALPETLLEGELFGYKKGIYTDARIDKIGLFMAAENGTLFLDEIGDLSLANQVKILHAVEKKGIRQIGSNKTNTVNVRIIAATNRNLDAMMQNGTFREDLYYRISTFRITSPPLREHPEDIPLLAVAHWNKMPRKYQLSKKFLEFLKSYQWPGNVRELFTLLNSLVDYFGDISPTPEHVEAIRKSRQETLIQSNISQKDDPAKLLKIKSQITLINVQNILLAIKVEMRPFINQEYGEKELDRNLEMIKTFISTQLVSLNELCNEPAFFKSREIFKATANYSYILNKTLKQWPSTSEKLRKIWISEIQKPDDEISKGIKDILWGKIDM
jgi:transcriptional regulator with AAA-type ATPase domain